MKIKICCISSIEEASLAIKYGATALGLVSHMPSGPGIIDEKLIAKIVAGIPATVESFLLTSLTNAAKIIAQHKIISSTAIQFVDALPIDAYKEIKDALPNIKLVQVVHVTDKNSVKEAIAIETYVDALLLDSGNPKATIKELGGTGRTHNWELSKQIVLNSTKPVYLAGGLNSNNIKEAITIVQPYGVDICSGVRTNNQLDEEKLKNYTKAILN
jgi:phosphoribosylanthranilate isomerase